MEKKGSGLFFGRSSGRVHPLVWILAAGLIVRLLLLVWFSGEPLRIFDEGDYNALAVNLLDGRGYTLDGQHATSLRPPLYPAVVAGVYAVFGVENYQAVRVLQTLISLASVALVYLLAVEIYDRRTGLWAAGLFCFYPSMLGHNNLLLTETLFTFWLVAVCLAVAWFLRRRSIGYLALAGVLIGLGASTRSILWLSPPLLAVYVLALGRISFRRRLAGVTLLIGAFAAVIAPWSIRCSRLEEVPVVIDTMGGQNFMMGNYEYTPLDRAWDAITQSGDRHWGAVLLASEPEGPLRTLGQRDKAALRYGLNHVRENPGLTVRRDVIKFFNFWQLDRSLVAGMRQGWFGNLPTPVILVAAAAITGSYAVVMVLGIFGAVMRRPNDWRVFGLLLAIVAYMCGLHTLVFAHSRYHLPLVPLILIFSAAALIHAGDIWRQRHTRAFRLATALCCVLAVSWVWQLVIDTQVSSHLAPRDAAFEAPEYAGYISRRETATIRTTTETT